jgi:hypothetical protein
MANKHVAMTDEERAERRKQEQQLTEQAVAQLRCSVGWLRWLTVRARVGLRRYSVLILSGACRRCMGAWLCSSMTCLPRWLTR